MSQHRDINTEMDITIDNQTEYLRALVHERDLYPVDSVRRAHPVARIVEVSAIEGEQLASAVIIKG